MHFFAAEKAWGAASQEYRFYRSAEGSSRGSLSLYVLYQRIDVASPRRIRTGCM
jgi:hypothetical protein